MVKTVYASSFCTLSSNVYTGGGLDDTAALQAVLDKAPEYGGLYLVVDGAALVTGLTVYSNTTIECLNADCGFYLADNQNRSIIENAHRSFDEINDRNITLIGGTYNHNSKHQVHTVLNANEFPDAAFGEHKWVICFEFYGVKNLKMRDLTVMNQRTFAMLIANWHGVDMENITITAPDGEHAQNQDGIHFWGPGRFLNMRNIRGWSGDDFIALAPDERDLVSSIEDVLIDGVFLDNADQGIRLLSRDKGRLDRVTIRNVTGTYTTYGFFINPWFPGGFGNYGNITIENVDLRQTTPVYDYTEPFLFCIGGKFDCLTLRNIYDINNSIKKLIRVGIANFDQWDLSRHTSQGTAIKTFLIDGLTVIKNAGACDLHEYIEIDAEIELLAIKNVLMNKADRECGEMLVRFKENSKVNTLVLSSIALEKNDTVFLNQSETAIKIIEK